MTVHRSVSRTIRNKFIAGLVILIPIVLTVKALWWLFTYVDSLAAPLALRMVGKPIPGIGFVITIAVVLSAGVLFSSGVWTAIWMSSGKVLNFFSKIALRYGASILRISLFSGFASASTSAFMAL